MELVNAAQHLDLPSCRIARMWLRFLMLVERTTAFFA
jgi:hypothetical protein